MLNVPNVSCEILLLKVSSSECHSHILGPSNLDSKDIDHLKGSGNPAPAAWRGQGGSFEPDLVCVAGARVQSYDGLTTK